MPKKAMVLTAIIAAAFSLPSIGSAAADFAVVACVAGLDAHRA